MNKLVLQVIGDLHLQ